jgi:hypothetical protein
MTMYCVVSAFRLFSIAAIFALSLQPVVAQEPNASDTAATDVELPATRGTQSGYDDIPEFGGPESVSSQLKKNDEEREFVYQFDNIQRGLAPYFDWKRSVNDEHGLSMGFSYYLLYQQASDSLANRDDDALGSIFRYQGNWTLFRRDNGNLGRIEWRVESRSNIGGF